MANTLRYPAYGFKIFNCSHLPIKVGFCSMFRNGFLGGWNDRPFLSNWHKQVGLKWGLSLRAWGWVDVAGITACLCFAWETIFGYEQSASWISLVIQFYWLFETGHDVLLVLQLQLQIYSCLRLAWFQRVEIRGLTVGGGSPIIWGIGLPKAIVMPFFFFLLMLLSICRPLMEELFYNLLVLETVT